MSNYLIGVGGVGSRIVESAVRLCECGYIDVDTINCSIVDVDTSNGNAGKTNELIEKYKQCRASLGATNLSSIFKTNIVGLGKRGDTYRITPLEGEAGTISIQGTLVNAGDEDSHALMSALYTEDEIKEQVDKGFYANPALGNTFFTYSMESAGGAKGELSELIKKIANDTNSGNVNLYIAASVFGGTGASGLAFICDKILEAIEKMPNPKRDNLHIHACLMLPYFAYDADGKDSEELKIDQNKFNSNALAALERYAIAKDVFDSVLLLGDPRKTIRGAYSDEGSSQFNWPHAVELFAAAEAGKFFSNDRHAEGAYKNTNWYANPFKVGSGDKIHALSWSDYDGWETLSKKIGDFILLNYYYSSYIIPMLFDSVGDKFVSWAFGKAAEAQDRLDDLADWAHESFVIEKKFLGLIKPTYSWREGIAVREFLQLFNYFTDSAQWYYKLVHEYGVLSGDHRPCWEQSLKRCDGVCTKSRDILLPRIFGTNGANMLAKRACMPKSSAFLADCSNFSKEIRQNALHEPRTSPELDNMDGMSGNLDGEGSQREVFGNLILKTYKRIVDTKKA